MTAIFSIGYFVRTLLSGRENIASIMKLINPQLEEPVTYNTYRYYVRTEDDLCRAWRAK